MQAVEQLLQRRQVLAVNEVLNQILARRILPVNQILHQLMAMQQLDDLLKLRFYAGTDFLSVSHQ